MSVVLRESRCVDCGKFIPEGSVRCDECDFLQAMRLGFEAGQSVGDLFGEMRERHRKEARLAGLPRYETGRGDGA